MTMRELSYQVSFNTPAFLGNAEQQGQWRTPPFKALLRQWWRVVKAPQVGYDHRRLLQAENELFGAASDDGHGGSHRSKLQVRLSGWDSGTLDQRPFLAKVDHPETKTREGKSIRPDADVYLGFGPIALGGMRNAIAPGGSALTLKLRCPEPDAGAICKAMQLVAWFGTVGSRSRNGWGSLHFLSEGLLGLEDLCDTKLAEQSSARAVHDALNDQLASEWPHALGLCADGRPAVWRVFDRRTSNADGKTVFEGFNGWKQALEKLAALKIGFRTQFSLQGRQPPHRQVPDRHVLAYPVTNHGLAGLNNARLASQMRFKVARSKDGQFFGLIFHLPSAMPAAFFDGSNVRPPPIAHQVQVWQQVHDFLNRQPATLITRIRKG